MALRPRLPRPVHAPHQDRRAVDPLGGRALCEREFTLSLQASSLRVSPLLANGVYTRSAGQGDIRFVDYFGATDVIVTSGASNDSGLFETSLHDERFLPFEGAGAISTWTLTLPPNLRAFDYTTISDVILHIRYTAREAGNPLGAQATAELAKAFMDAKQSPQALLLCLKYDFPTEWAAFVNGQAAFQAVIDRSFLPYYAQAMTKIDVIGSVRLFYAKSDGSLGSASLTAAAAIKGSLSAAAGATLSLSADTLAMATADPGIQIHVLIGYTCKT